MHEITKKRVDWVDISKGIAMLSIIMFHSVGFGGVVHNILISFVVQLFFVLSGFFAKCISFKECFIKKCKTLLVPYFAFLLIGFVLTLILPEWRASLSLKDVGLDLLYGNPNTLNVSSVWFLLCLFFVTIICNSIIHCKKVVQVIIVAIITVFGFIYGYLYALEKITYRLPFDFDVVFMAIPFYMIGFWFKDYICVLVNKVKSMKLFSKVTIVFADMALWLVTAYFNGQTNMHGLKYNNIVLYFVASLFGCLFVMMFSSIINIKPINAFLLWLGKNSLYVLGAQAIFIRLFLLIINPILHTSYGLYSLPMKYAVVCFVYVTVLSCFCVFIYTKIKEKIKGKIYENN